MTLFRFILRGIWHYRHTGAPIALAIAIAVATLIGSLLVGHSVSASLRATALARLGGIDSALATPHFFRTELADDLRGENIRNISAVLALRGVARNTETGATLPKVNVFGVDGEFIQFFRSSTALDGRAVAMNDSLARDIGLREGDALLLKVEKPSPLSARNLFAQKDPSRAGNTLRLRVAAVLPDKSVGGFSLNSESITPRNLFIDRAWLAAQLELGQVANVLLASGDDESLQRALEEKCDLADYGLTIATDATRGYARVESSGMLLRPAELAAVEKAARDAGARCFTTSVYLADTLRIRARGTQSAYSMIAAAPDLSSVDASGIVLNQWAAEDLHAQIGDMVDLDYLIPADDGSYRISTFRLTVRGIVPLAGKFADPNLIPAIHGITDADGIDAWSAPFPVDLARVTPRDEEYWDLHRATPRAFIAPETARMLWREHAQSEWITGARIFPKSGKFSADMAGKLSTGIKANLPPSEAGLTFRPVRKLALQASAGSTDFGQLFLAMSFFLMAAAGGLAAAMMRLQVERRSAEIGLLLAVGIPGRKSALMQAAEGGALILAGALGGAALGVGYAWLIIFGLTGWWRGAMGETPLEFHLDFSAIIIGALVGAAISALAMLFSGRQLRGFRVTRLLAGWQAARINQPSSPLFAVVLSVSILAFCALLALSILSAIAPAPAFFGLGACLLVGSLAGCGVWLQRAMRPGVPSRGMLAVRGAAANRGRSLLVIGLLASAVFILVTVAANRKDFHRADVSRREYGAGGFSLRALSSLPMPIQFGTSEGRKKLKFNPADEAIYRGVEVMPFRVSPGDDISCLNLAKPVSPRLLGVSDEMITRGGFTIQTAGRAPANPWTLLKGDPSGAIPVFADADSVMWSLHSGLGKTYELPGPDGKPVAIKFIGLIHGSIFAGEILMSEENFARLHPNVTAPRYFLISAPAGREASVARSLRANLGELGVEIHSTRDILNGFIAVQNTYLATFLALGGLGMLLGALGLGVTLTRNIIERRPELAMMTALGIPRETITAILIREHLALLLAGTAIGALSALLACLPQLRSAEAQVNWPSVLLLLAALLAVGFGSIVLTTRHLMRGEVIEGLRGE